MFVLGLNSDLIVVEDAGVIEVRDTELTVLGWDTKLTVLGWDTELTAAGGLKQR